MTDRPNLEKKTDFLIKYHMVYQFDNSLIKYILNKNKNNSTILHLNLMFV